MKRLVVLLRHGNTFAPSDKVVMVGAQQDLPLVESGRDQARSMAEALAQSGATQLHAAPLLRTAEYARIVGEPLALSPILDARLKEIDYGAWAGLSDDEVRARGDGDALEAWRHDGTWPAHIFGEDHDDVLARVQAFYREVIAPSSAPVSLVVSSQGVLRFFLRLIPGAYEAQAGRLGIKTGHGALLSIDELARLSVVGWNLAPRALAAEVDAARR